jgi:hypothetical protein
MSEEWKKFYTIEVSNIGNLKTPRHNDGKYVGVDNGYGYKQIMVKIDNKYSAYMVHRLVSHLFNDVALDDPRQVDHINGIRDDNRVENLRMVSHSDNMVNKKCHRNGKLPYCHFNKERNKWGSQMVIDGKKIYGGLFDTMIEAHNKSIEIKKESSK